MLAVPVVLPDPIAPSGYRQLVAALAMLDQVDQPTARLLLLAAHDALQQRGGALAVTLEDVARKSPAARQAIDRLFDASLAKLTDSSIPEKERVAEAALLQLDGRSSTAQRLLGLLSEDSSTASVAATRPPASLPRRPPSPRC